MTQPRGGGILAAEDVEPAVRADGHGDVDERVLDAPRLAGRKAWILLLRHEAARAAPHRRARPVEAQDLIAHEGREVNDAVLDRDRARIHELGEVADLGHMDDPESGIGMSQRVEHPEQRRAAVFRNELDEVLGARGHDSTAVGRI